MRRTLLLVALALLAAAAPAGAENRIVAPFGGGPTPLVDGDPFLASLDGPFLSGDEVVWLERRPGVLAVVADGPGGRRDVDATTAEGTPEPLSFDLDVAEGRVGLTTFHFTCGGSPDCVRARAQYPADHAALAGPVAGPLTKLDTHCGLASADVAATAFLGRCLQSGGVELHEEGQPPRTLGGDSFSPSQVAGEFVARPIKRDDGAWVGVQVLRRPQLDEVYRVELGIDHYDLQPDGSLVYDVRGVAEVGWSSPSDPAVHRIAVPGVPFGVAGAGARLAVQLDRRLVVVDRLGTTLADIADPAYDSRDFDYDGTRLTWARRPCARYSFVVWDLAQPQPALAGTDCTMPGHGSGTLRVRAGRRVALTITCPQDAPAGCAGVTALSAYLRRRPAGRRSLRGSAAESFDLLPGESATIGMRLRKKGLRRFRGGEVRIETTLAKNRQEQTTRRRLRLR
ncbi:MAG TPA: hypothetical protein VF587_08830 [Solirubrobacteraceae bacterium]|jgi:hypothetical protein